MMEYKNILVMVDPSKQEQPSLARAAFLARSYGAKISLFLCIYDLSYEMTSMLSQDEREAMRSGVVEQQRQWLLELAAQYDDLTIETTVSWFNRPFEAAIKHVQQHQIDLLVKSTHKHDKLKSVIFTPTDWHLLRKSPCDVLLVKEHDWPEDGQIVTAINAVSEDEDHIYLNQKVMQHATDLGKVINGNVKVVNSFPGTPVNIAIEIPEFNTQEYNSSVYKHHLQATEQLAQQYDLATSCCIIKEGLAEDVIPEVAKELDAELVIIGTIGRTGLSAAFIGNTAEHIIDQIDCDLLAIKPDGFVSPVQSD
ncbi:universal stress protein UspE [Psychrobium sp. 1_MG-2023]|uniref:universal stress protein UspE n=1 Tax=Psychrobium sp. 1_MG-2023 TaxID=3062624 RepID=UPI000C347F9C|nr:universal stress protein UspE [Psychrobium sp. 1_MG-2023]MDP2561542.1 universal stress protein UspE [Psychrobium sp. 1_MG-2023]PKF55005.1 universal stress protein UspE [Alteromonadales bacterium alter-6D02]